MYNYSGNSAGAEAAINTYDPYFPSQHHVNSVNSSTSSPSVTSSVSNEDYTYQQTVLVLPTRISKKTLESNIGRLVPFLSAILVCSVG